MEIINNLNIMQQINWSNGNINASTSQSIFSGNNNIQTPNINMNMGNNGLGGIGNPIGGSIFSSNNNNGMGKSSNIFSNG